ncbi:MAG: translation initiation factor IF-2 [Candidatus Lokiarchaeota archaeon]|nr:translation initiation factor IF-2 [Candidatus Lokiarchaeota archaeon]
MNSDKHERSPIVVIMGHIDSGKTSLLDRIRKTSVQIREAGGITQHIGASFFPKETINEISGNLLRSMDISLDINGLLIIDTPGHEAFMNLRRRGNSVADIAILVIDINAGFQVQTYECIKILKERKTPFLIAANKIDRIPGWNPMEKPLLETIKEQKDFVRKEMDKKIYEIVGELSEEGFNSERFDRVRDFSKSVAIVPTSAETSDGIPELLMVLSGLTMSFLKKRLEVELKNGKGTILEVKEETGLGTTIDTILYDGIIKQNDIIVVGGKTEPIITKVKALLIPKPLDEIRDPRERFKQIDKVVAAMGIKIVAPDLDGVVAGAPVLVANNDEEIEKFSQEVKEEMGELIISADNIGVVLKADTLGSLEALLNYLKQRDIPVRIADVGSVSKRDVIEADIVKQKDPTWAAILSFNVKTLPDAREEILEYDIKVFENNIIYRLIEEFQYWHKDQVNKLMSLELENMDLPATMQFLPGYTFRKSDPIIIGVKVLNGVLKPKQKVINNQNRRIGEIKQIQDKGENIKEAKKGMEVAVSIRSQYSVGRQVNEGDLLYVDMSEFNYRTLRDNFKNQLSESDLAALKDLITIKREEDKFWGI